MLRYDDCIVYLLAKAYQKAHGSLKKRLAPFGLTPVQLLVLASLWDEDGISAGEIGKKLVLDSATLSGVLDRLAEKQWILKETDPEDRRSLKIRLSDKGNLIRPDVSRERQLANDEILEAFSVEEKVILKRLLRDIR